MKIISRLEIGRRMYRLLTVKGLPAKAEVFCWVLDVAIAALSLSVSVFIFCKAVKQFL